MNERQFGRIWVKLPVEYSAGSSNCRIGYSSNLSPCGAMLNIHERLGVNQRIDLAIFASLGARIETIKLQSQIVWVDDAAQEGRFLFGAQFVDPTATEIEKLARVFEECSIGGPTRDVPTPGGGNNVSEYQNYPRA